MITHISEKLSSLFISQGIIPEEDREVYEYSFGTLFSAVFSFTALFLIAVITRTIGYTALYLIGFIPLRIIAGGYHAKNHFRCFIILICAYTAYLLLLTYMPMEYMLSTMYFSITASVISVFILAPSDDSNKPMSDKDKVKGRKSSRILIIVYVLIVILLVTFVTNLRIPLSFVFGSLTLSISLLANMVKYKVRRRNNTDICKEGLQNEET